MRLVFQRGNSDCGVATAAMIAGVSYERALAAFTPRVRARLDRHGITTVELADALATLGVTIGRRRRPLRKRQLSSLSGPMILCVSVGPTKRAREWHWVAYDGDKRQLFDPAQALQPYVVESYVPVL